MSIRVAVAPTAPRIRSRTAWIAISVLLSLSPLPAISSAPAATPAAQAAAPAEATAAPVTAPAAASTTPAPNAAPSAITAPAAADTGSSAIGELMGIVLPLVLIIVVLLAVLYLVRRRFGLTGQDAPLSVLQILPLGPRERLVLVRSRSGRIFTVGVAAQSVTLVTHLDAADLIAPNSQSPHIAPGD